MTTDDKNQIPPEFRPPNVWPTVLLGVVTILVSMYAAQSSYQASQKVAKAAIQNQHTIDLRCESFAHRLTITPETAMERYLRTLAKDEFSRDCKP